MRNPNMWPWPDRRVVCDLDFIGNRAWCGSKGRKTIASVLSVSRSGQSVPAEIGNGFMRMLGSDAPRITPEGLWIENTASGLAKNNMNLSASTFTLTNCTAAAVLPAPYSPVISNINVITLAAGTTSWTVPDGVSSINVYCGGPGGNGANGVANVSSGAGGGGGAYASGANVAVTAGQLVDFTNAGAQPGGIPVGGSQLPTQVHYGGVLKAKADFGRNASGTTAGTQGTIAGSSGDVTQRGAAGGAGVAAVSRGGGAGGGSGTGRGIVPGGNGAAGNGQGGGGGGQVTNGTNATLAAAGVGGVGGQGISNGGGGTGGTTTTAAGAGTQAGAGGGGGSTLVGIDGAAGAVDYLSFTDPLTGETVTATAGPSGGGGGGGLGGNGGFPGGGGGATAAVGGTGAAGLDGWVVITWGGTAAYEITATGSNATVTQSITITGGALNRMYGAWVYLSQELTGRAWLTFTNVDTGDLTTEITSLCRVGGWHKVTMDTFWSSANNATIGIKLENSGDKIGWIPQVQGGPIITQLVPTQASGTRAAEYITLDLTKFPAFINNDGITVLMVVEPHFVPRPHYQVPALPAGWTALQIGSNYDYVATFTASFTDNGDGTSKMTVTDVSVGALAVEDAVAIGAAVGTSAYEILSQDSGSAGGAGDYTVSGSRTAASTTLQTRTMNFNGYRFNSSLKPTDLVQIGVTLFREQDGLQTAIDPAFAFSSYNARNAMGFVARQSTKRLISSLAGNSNEHVPLPASFPDTATFDHVVVGAQYPDGSSALQGPVRRLIIMDSDVSRAELDRWTVTLARYG